MEEGGLMILLNCRRLFLLASFDLCWMCENVDVDVGCAVLGVLALAQIMGFMGYQTCVTEISSCIINHSHSFRHQLHRIL